MGADLVSSISLLGSVTFAPVRCLAVSLYCRSQSSVAAPARRGAADGTPAALAERIMAFDRRTINLFSRMLGHMFVVPLSGPPLIARKRQASAFRRPRIRHSRPGGIVTASCNDGRSRRVRFRAAPSSAQHSDELRRRCSPNGEHEALQPILPTTMPRGAVCSIRLFDGSLIPFMLHVPPAVSQARSVQARFSYVP